VPFDMEAMLIVIHSILHHGLNSINALSSVIAHEMFTSLII